MGDAERARRSEEAAERERDAVDDAGLGTGRRVADAVAHLALFLGVGVLAGVGVGLGVADAAGAAAERAGGPRARGSRGIAGGAVAGGRRADGVPGGLVPHDATRRRHAGRCGRREREHDVEAARGALGRAAGDLEGEAADGAALDEGEQPRRVFLLDAADGAAGAFATAEREAAREDLRLAGRGGGRDELEQLRAVVADEDARGRRGAGRAAWCR